MKRTHSMSMIRRDIDFTGQYKVLMETAIETAFAIVSAIVLIYLILINERLKFNL